MHELFTRCVDYRSEQIGCSRIGRYRGFTNRSAKNVYLPTVELKIEREGRDAIRPPQRVYCKSKPAIRISLSSLERYR